MIEAIFQIDVDIIYLIENIHIILFFLKQFVSSDKSFISENELFDSNMPDKIFIKCFKMLKIAKMSRIKPNIS